MNPSSHRSGCNQEHFHVARRGELLHGPHPGASPRPAGRGRHLPGALPLHLPWPVRLGGLIGLSDQGHLLDAGANLPRPTPASDRLLLKVLPGPPKPTLCEGLSHLLPHPDLSACSPNSTLYPGLTPHPQNSLHPPGLCPCYPSPWTPPLLYPDHPLLTSQHSPLQVSVGHTVQSPATPRMSSLGRLHPLSPPSPAVPNLLPSSVRVPVSPGRSPAPQESARLTHSWAQVWHKVVNFAGQVTACSEELAWPGHRHRPQSCHMRSGEAGRGGMTTMVLLRVLQVLTSQRCSSSELRLPLILLPPTQDHPKGNREEHSRKREGPVQRPEARRRWTKPAEGRECQARGRPRPSRIGTCSELS